MFESFRPKPETENKPINPERRKALETIGAVGMTALAGVTVTGRIGQENQITKTKETPSPKVSSGIISKFESTRPLVMEQLVHALKTEGKDVYILAIEFLTGLKTEKVTLLKRKVHIVDELKTLRNSDPKQPFLLLENDRINTSLAELDTYIQEIGTALEQSPFHNTPAEVLMGKPENKGYIDNQNLPNTVRERKRIM